MMRTVVVVLGLIAVLAARAVADPVFTVDERDYEVAIGNLAEQLDEPVGLFAIARIPKLGLEKGDLVRAINGAPPSKSFGALRMHDGVSLFHLFVLRGKKEVVVTVRLTLKPIEEHVERPRFIEDLERTKQFGVAGDYVGVTKDGTPSGVIIKVAWFLMMKGPTEGDVIRRIDGHAVTTPDEVAAAFELAKDHPNIVLDLERLGQPLRVTLTFDDPPKEVAEIADQIVLIKKVDDTTWEIPRKLVDLVLSNPMAIAKGARVVPAVKNGVASGFKLYAIRPSSVYAAIGLQNGDTLLKINGQELSTADKALEIYTKLKDAKTIKVELERRGIALKLEWRIK